jgi:hypothetical protein
MTAAPLRRGLVYAATGMFFAVAALAQLQGAAFSDVLKKAAISCAIVIAIGLVLVHIVEDAARAEAEARKRARTERMAEAASVQADEQAAKDQQ